MSASIDPHGNTTAYYFEYGKEDCATAVVACVKVPVSKGIIPAGPIGVGVSVTVSGLEPGATYHFRVIAESKCNTSFPEEECPAVGGDNVFRTFPLAPVGPPDDRLFELVSPPVKNGGEVFPPSPRSLNCGECLTSDYKLPGEDNEHFPMQSTADGDSVVFEGEPFSATGDAANENEYLSSRSINGWGGGGLSPELEAKEPPQGFKMFSSDLSRGVLYQVQPSLSPESLIEEASGVPYADLYLEDTASGHLGPLLASSSVSVSLERSPGASGKNALTLGFVGGSSDFGHLVFQANAALTSATGVAPAAQSIPESEAGKNNLYEWVDGGLRLVNVLPGNSVTEAGAVFGSGGDLTRVISADGSRVFWTYENNQHVYVRENGDATEELPGFGAYVTASTDGSKVLLGSVSSDLHVYDLQSKTDTDLSEGKGGFQGVLGTSQDLSSVYFVDAAALGGASVGNSDNLYVWHDGVATFVATLSPGDDEPDIYGQTNEPGDWTPSPSQRTAQASPNGEYLTFMSRIGLTDFDNNPAEVKDCNGSCTEVFEYSESTGKLVCASCNP